MIKLRHPVWFYLAWLYLLAAGVFALTVALVVSATGWFT